VLAGGRVLGDEDVELSFTDQGRAAEAGRELKVSGHGQVAAAICGDAITVVVADAAVAIRPLECAVPGVFHDEDIGAAGTGEGAAAEVDGAAEQSEESSCDDVAVIVEGDTLGAIESGASRRPRPEGAAVERRVGGQEDVGETFRGQRPASQISRSVEVAGEDDRVVS
jgi:hypothetical protein